MFVPIETAPPGRHVVAGTPVKNRLVFGLVGRLSDKVAFENALVVGLLIVIVNVLVCPAAKVVGEKALSIVSEVTTRFAEAGAWLVAPSKVCKSPAGIVFVYGPAALDSAIAVAVMVQEELAGIVPPSMRTVCAFGNEMTPPAQVVDPVAGTYSRSAGSTSSKAGGMVEPV